MGTSADVDAPRAEPCRSTGSRDTPASPVGHLQQAKRPDAHGVTAYGRIAIGRGFAPVAAVPSARSTPVVPSRANLVTLSPFKFAT